MIEFWVNDTGPAVFVGDGPMLQFLVDKGPPFMGEVQLNPTLSFRQVEPEHR